MGSPSMHPDGPPSASVLGLTREELRALPCLQGEPSFRASQIFEGIHRHRWTSWDAFTILGRSLRERLGTELSLASPSILETHTSTDASVRHILALEDGALVEAVHIPYADRRTLCLSSQVGCALGCTFCATGRMGLQRSLGAAEIIGQVRALLTAHPEPRDAPVNLVFMGMGEPLHNLDQVMRAFELLTDTRGMAIPSRRITVSTAGVVPGIARLGTYGMRPRLAVSLNATTDAARSELMPINRSWGLDALADALQAFPLGKGERITLEFVVVDGVNDSPEDGRRLAEFARRFPSKVNLIPLNPLASSHLRPPGEARLERLCSVLAGAGVTVAIRRSRGQDISGACGQLATLAQEKRGPSRS